jgi:hypothetical protein
METSYIEVRDPKTPNANKTRLATSTLIGANINHLYIVNSRSSKILWSYFVTISITKTRPTKFILICNFFWNEDTIKTNMLCVFYGWNEDEKAKKCFKSVCTLRWLISFSIDVPFPNNPYDGVKMAIYFDIIKLLGNYMVVNELKRPIWKIIILFLFFNVHVKKIKVEIHPKNDYYMDLWKYSSF